MKINNLDQLPIKQVPFFHCALDNLELVEVSDYINHRLKAVDYQSADLFTPSAVTEIARFTRGNPRIINKICNAALLYAGNKNKALVSKEVVIEVSKDYSHQPKIENSKTVEANTLRFITPKTWRNIVLGMVALTILGLSITLFRVTWQPSFFDGNLHRSTISRIDKTINTGPRKPQLKKRYLSDVNQQIKVMQKVESIKPKVLESNEGPTDRLNTKAEVKGLDGNRSWNKVVEDPMTSKTDIREAVFQNKKSAGQNARHYIYALQNSGQIFVAEEVFDQAEKLNKQGLVADAFLLYFYLAKQGNGDAAFKLAQIYDPATFNKNENFIESSNIVVAKKWYKLAVDAGHPDANYRLGLLNNLEISQGASVDIRIQN